MKLLIAPLVKLGNLIEEEKKTIDEIHTVLKVDLKKASTETHKELKQHTVLLGEIRDLLKQQNAQKGEKSSGGPKIKLPGVMSGIGAGLAIITMAAALVAAAGIFSLMPSVSPAQLLTAIAIGAVFVILAPIFTSISESLRGGGLYERVVGKVVGASSGITGTKELLENVGGTGLAMVSMAIGVTAAAAIFKLMTQPSVAQIATAFLIGIAMIPIAISFANFYLAMTKRGIGLNKKGLKVIGFTTLAMVSAALAIVGVAKIFELLPATQNAPDVGWTLKTGFALFVFTIPFVKIMKVIKGRSLKDITFAALALPVLAAAIAGIAFLTSKFGGDITYENAPPVEWVLKVGLALFVFSLPFMMAMKAIKGAKIKDVIFGALALPLLAGAIFGVAWIFNYLSEVGSYNAPPVEWTLKAGLAMAVFGVPFILIATLISKAGIGFMDLIKATLSVIAIAGAILATAWIFSLLPEEYKAPTTDWAIASGIAIGIFAIPFAIVGLLAQVLSPAGLLLGALGMILIAGTMWVVAWIFSTLPDLSAISKNFTDAIMYPVNSMIDALNRFKNEIGIENMLPMAGGILAIAGSWLALTAALAGSSIGGVLGAAANVGKAIFDGISKFFGGDAAETPISLLDKLIEKKAGIQALAKAMPALGGQFAVIAAHTDAVVRGMAAFTPFLVEANAESFTESATAAEKMAKAYKKIGKATETMNVEAIKETRYMFDSLTKLAEADGEDALTVFAEKLMVAVEELSGTVENLQNAVGEQSSGIKDVISGLLSKVTDKVKEVTGGSQDNDTDESKTNMSEVVELLGEIEERLNRPLRIIAE